MWQFYVFVVGELIDKINVERQKKKLFSISGTF